VPSSGPHAGNLRLLKGINGVFRPHVLTALMGASGAGGWGGVGGVWVLRGRIKSANRGGFGVQLQADPPPY
jgi:hypothetical protein